MIEYSETWLILTLLRWKGAQRLTLVPDIGSPWAFVRDCHMTGSVFPRSCYFAIPSALLTGLLLQAEANSSSGI